MKALLNEALHAFRLDGAEAVFLQHNENLTYRVDGRYLLRIHKAAESLHVTHDPDARQAELAFLRHLADHGLLVQRPVGEAVLPDGTQSTLLTWLAGRSLANDDLSPDMCRRIGSMTAQLHHAAAGYSHPHILRYDAAFYLRMADKLDGILGLRPIPRAACLAVAQRIGCDMNCAVHADLSPSNILLTPDGLAPIDFSLCGLGHPMLDLGILIASLSSAEQMRAVCEGYGEYQPRELEAGFAAGLLGCFALHPTWVQEPWFQNRLDRWERQILLPVAENRPMFDSHMNFINR